jgi:uncharacterized caspase-like protein
MMIRGVRCVRGMRLFTVMAAAIITFVSANTSIKTSVPSTPQASAARVAKLPVSNKRFALIIGVDAYQDAEISNLRGAANDAKAIADALVNYAGFPSDQIILLTSEQSTELQPTRANIIRRLSNLRQVVPKDGLLWVSFSGHGIERDQQAYLLPMDAQLSGDVALLEDSAINVQTMRDRIRQTEVAQVIFILDACRNNPLSGRGLSVTKLTDQFTRAFSFDIHNKEIKAFATIYATGPGQVAHEYKQKKQGYFTAALVDGLKGAASNEKGEVKLSDLVKYVQNTVPIRIALDLGGDKQQRPWADIQGYQADDLIIALPIAFGAPSATQESQLPPSTTLKSSPARPDSRSDQITGSWGGTYGPGAFPFVLKLRLEGEIVSGEVTIDGNTGAITQGTWKRGELVITIVQKGNRMMFRGSLLEGTLSGRQYRNGSTNFLQWTATKK